MTRLLPLLALPACTIEAPGCRDSADIVVTASSRIACDPGAVVETTVVPDGVLVVCRCPAAEPAEVSP